MSGARSSRRAIFFASATFAIAGVVGCFVSIDESKLDPQDAALDSQSSDVGSSDANEENDDACNRAADEIFFSGHARSKSEIDLSFTSGPPYELDRGLTGDIKNGIPATKFTSFSACTSGFVDQSYGDAGDGSINVGVNDAGLTQNYDYTYSLKPLLDDGGVDPQFNPLTITVRTFMLDGGPAPDSDAGTFEMASP